MLSTIAIVGRPNVGKSTLFNRLTQSRDALVADLPGVTRDRLYGQGRVGDQPYIVIDTGGLDRENTGITALMLQQTQQAIQEADHILFLVDGRAGLTANDQVIAQSLRELGKPVTLVINKTEGLDPINTQSEFYSLGLGEPVVISASHGLGIIDLMDTVLKTIPAADNAEETLSSPGVKIAIVGRPNVGKSTLTNRMLGEERVVVYNQPGTTRDSIYIPFERHGKQYILIDTAGVRRRSKIDEKIEKFSVTKTLQAVESAHVVILVLDASEKVADQDLHLLGYIVEAGKALVIAVNKWDGLTPEQREFIHNDLERRLAFANFAKIKFISALHGTGVGDLFTLVDEAYFAATKALSTPQLTRILEQAIATHQPPLVKGRRVKLRYAHAGGHNPPTIVIHGKQTHALPGSYQRYLESFFRKTLHLVGTPIRIIFRDSENPYV